jgi:hypothetical protein
MPLDSESLNHANRLFQKRQEEILQTYRQKILDLRSDFAARGMLSSGPYLSAHVKVLLDQGKLLAEARKECFIQAYAKAGTPFDDTALNEISQEITNHCEGYRQHATAAILQMVGQTFPGRAPVNLGQALSGQIESGMSGVKARVLRDLAIMRDEAKLAARASKATTVSLSGISSAPKPNAQDPHDPDNQIDHIQSGRGNASTIRVWAIRHWIAVATLIIGALSIIATVMVPELRRWSHLDPRAPEVHPPLVTIPPRERKPEPAPLPPKLLVAEFGGSIQALRKRHNVTPLPDVESEKSLSEIPANSYSFADGFHLLHKQTPEYVKMPGLYTDYEVHKLGDGTVVVLGYVGAESLIRLREGMPKDVELILYSEGWREAPKLVSIPLSELRCDRDRYIHPTGRLTVGALDCKADP